MNRRLFFLSLIMLLFLGSCETDFDLNAEWKDITVVYGILNQNDSAQYIRVQKAFLGEGNTLLMAQEPDSNIYPGVLDVAIEEWNGNVLRNTFNLDTITIKDKEPGLFFYPELPLFYMQEEINPDYKYKLLITNRETGKVISSETELVGNYSVSRPALNTQINFQVTGTDKKTFSWRRAKNAGRYQMILRFNYLDVDTETNDTIPRNVEWLSQIIKTSGATGIGDIEIVFTNETFFSMIMNRVPKLDNVIRYPVNVDIIVNAAGTELSTYMEVNEPSSSLVQEKPEYTNIENGLGIFSARYSITSSHRLHFQTINRLVEMDGYNFQWIP